MCLRTAIVFFGRIEKRTYRISMMFVGRTELVRSPWRMDRWCNDETIDPSSSVFTSITTFSIIIELPLVLRIPRHPERDVTSLTDPQVTIARLMRDLTAYSHIRHSHARQLHFSSSPLGDSFQDRYHIDNNSTSRRKMFHKMYILFSLSLVCKN